MSLNIHYEAQLVVLSFLTGIFLMISYDILRILRILIAHRPIFVGIEDMIYWIYAGLITFTLLYRQNDGSLRSYVIGGVFMGMLLYNITISSFLVKLLKKISGCIKMNLHKIAHRHKSSK